MIYTLFLLLQLYLPQTVETSSHTFHPSTNVVLRKMNMAETDISGFWEGTITRDEGYGKRVMFDIEVIFTQKGKDITGISIVRAVDNNRTYNAKMELSGKLKGTYLKYVETKILSADVIPEAEWCIKKVELIYKNTNNVPTLDGIWEGVTGSSRSCIPGRVSLRRKPPRV